MRTVRPREYAPIGPSMAPDEPICDDPSCLLCGIGREPGETREAFVARVRALLLDGSLSFGGVPFRPSQFSETSYGHR